MADPIIPLVDLAAQYESIKDDVDARIRDVIESTQFINGPAVGEFERTFADLVGVKHAIGVASGTEALTIAVRALGIGPGDEVITQTNSWISTAFCISQAGARPVLVDIDPNTYQMSIEGLEQAITPATKAVIPVHMFGHPAPMVDIVRICRARGIRVIEDVAQAPLAELDGRRTGTFGDLACFSFYPSKNLGCYGDGGAVLCDDPELATSVRRLANYGQVTPHVHDYVGFNSRLDTMQAAVLLAKVGRLKAWNAARRERAAEYGKKLSELPVTLPAEAPGAKSVFHLYPVQLDDRDACLAFLRDRGILAQVHYLRLIHRQPCYADLGYRAEDFPAAERISGRMLSLPLYPELTGKQIDRIVATLAAFFGSRTT